MAKFIMGTRIIKTYSVFFVVFIFYIGPMAGINPILMADLQLVDHVIVDQWTKKNGLPSDSIHALARGPEGFLWISTDKGVIRYDGLTFEPVPYFQIEPGAPLQNTKSHPLLLDGENILWIGSESGLTSYDYRSGRFNTYHNVPGLKKKIRRLYRDIRGNLWISLFSGYIFRYAEGTFTHFNQTHGLTVGKINAVVETQSGHLLFASRSGSVFLYRDGRFTIKNIPGLEKRLIFSMIEDDRGVLWIGTDNGLICYNGSRTRHFTTADGLIGNQISYLYNGTGNTVWVGTRDGLDRIRTDNDGRTRIQNLIGSVVISCVLADPEGSVWAGTDKNGLKRLKNPRFTHGIPRGVDPKDPVISAYLDTGGDILCGTLHGKILSVDRDGNIKTVLHQLLPDGTGVTCLARDNDGNLWLGTNGAGVFRMDKKKTVNFSRDEGLADNIVTAIFRDKKGNLWFSTFDGASLYRSTDGFMISLKHPAPLSNRIVNTVFEDSRGTVWIATNSGITVLPGGEMSAAKPLESFEKVPVTAVLEDPQQNGRFWIATKNAGLICIRLKEEKIVSRTTFNKTHGLVTDNLYQFTLDSSGNFWLTADTGVLRIKKRTLNLLNRNSGEQADCVWFDESDGLKSVEFHNVTSPHSLLNAGDRGLWFTTLKGVSVVYPEKMPINPVAPRVAFQSAVFRDTPVPYYRLNERNPGEPFTFSGTADVRFHFTAPTFLSPRKIKFKYRLLPVDKQWRFILPGRERAVRFPGLTPGRYTFQVTAGNADGIWNHTHRSFRFVIRPYFYQTFFFKLMAFLFIVLVVFSLARIIRKRKKYTRQPGRTEQPGESPSTPVQSHATTAGKYQSPPMEPDYVARCVRKLESLMEDEKMFRDADLTLPLLAGKIPIAHHKLSRILNETLNQGFSDYINTYRIREACRLVTGPGGSDMNITTIAFDVGFNTMTAFYKAFRKQTGTTPRDFKKKAAQESKKEIN